jgi:hypothetical protein
MRFCIASRSFFLILIVCLAPLFFRCAVQGWSSVIPRFSVVDFLSFYIELPRDGDHVLPLARLASRAQAARHAAALLINVAADYHFR